jgi:hypothetical protein
MRETERTKIIWQEWDAFCDLLLEGTRVCDSGKSLPDHQTSDPYPASECSKMLDLYLRMAFEPPDGGIPPEPFAEVPPVLQKALALRIARAKEILTRILETPEGREIRNESDLAGRTKLFFRDLLLPSPPEPGSYTWKKNL